MLSIANKANLATRAIRTGAAAAGMLVVAICSLPAIAGDVENYRLTEDRLGRYERATEAMYQFAEAHPEIAQKLRDDDEQDETEDDNGDAKAMAESLDARAPGLRAAVEKSGMKLEEYFLFSIVVAGNALGVAFADQFGGGNDAALSEVQRANMQFVRKHMQRFEMFAARMQEKYPSLATDDDDDSEDFGDDEYLDEYQDQ